MVMLSESPHCLVQIGYIFCVCIILKTETIPGLYEYDKKFMVFINIAYVLNLLHVLMRNPLLYNIYIFI